MKIVKANTIYGKIKLLIILVGVVFLILFTILLIYKKKQETQILNSSQKQYISDINSLFTIKSSQMQKTIYDYTYWDKFVTAVENNDTSWYNKNIDFNSEVYSKELERRKKRDVQLHYDQPDGNLTIISDVQRIKL